ncbi:MAG: hypothetical protein M1438_19785 [Deltaproteobacteria bacterium]|nr:hypothetical protein [Deltaproteobacteria bacterium]
MLKEYAQILQPEGRRWFGDDYFDLIVWSGKHGEIVGFQLCYDLGGDERALTWHEKTGFGHQRVDDGDLHRPFKATPILIADGECDAAAILRRFQEHSGLMDEQVAGFVLKKIETYRSKSNPG